MNAINKLLEQAEKNLLLYVSPLYINLEKDLGRENDEEDFGGEGVEIFEWAGQLSGLCEQEGIEIVGSADEIHNLSVVFARNGCPNASCAILGAALREERYSGEVDLLADFIQYSSSAGRRFSDQAQKYYERLCEIPRIKWNWRAYEFAIDYLMNIAERQPEKSDEIKLKYEGLADEYCENFKQRPEADRAFHSKANVAYKDNNIEKYQETLNEAIDTLERAPVCALYMAEYEFKRGKNEEAERYIQQCIEGNRTIDNNVNIGYPYVLSALCKIFNAYQQLNNDEVIKKYMKEIEEDYDSALTWLSSKDERVGMLKKHIRVLKKRTNISDDYEE